ncbi:MAG: hypothetical protein DHS20C17_09110 [Cyclobacteriaceae bacterium]|nr:MAG: hypothetical protein DHS20C17_09110 [Cyclobacteriaceae bacterium]
MFGLFKNDPLKKKRKEYKKRMLEARDIQRSGDLKLYARKMEEADKLAQEIQNLTQ